MKTKYRSLQLLILIWGALLVYISPLSAAGLLKATNGADSSIKIKSHHVDVTINNGFSKTEVDQVFMNTGNKDLDAVYSFPVPANASLSELSLWIDGEEMIGEVMEKNSAKKVYQEQKAKGNETALAEKKEYVAFNINVTPVRANDETRVRIVYYQPVELDLNVGRYVYPLKEGNVDELSQSFWAIDSDVKSSFKFNLELKSAYPVKDVRIPGFETGADIRKVMADEEGTRSETYKVVIDKPEGAKLNRDVVFYYRLHDDTPARVEMIPYRNGRDDGSFMVVVTPGGVLNKLSEGTDWTFVLDVSGSMNGEKITTLGKGVIQVIDKMKSEDRFRIITFSDSAKDYSGGYLKASRRNVVQMIKNVKNLRTGGSTALYAGLEMAYQGIDEERSTGIVLVTDGVANDGPSDDIDIIELHKKYDVRLFSFVMGNSANQPLLETLSKDSGGFAMNVSTSDDIIGRILQAKAKLTHECLYNTELTISGGDVYGLTPAKIGNIYKGQQIVMFGRYETPSDIEIKLTGNVGGEDKSWIVKTFLPEKDTDNPELERLWALSAIKDLKEKIIKSPHNEGHKKKVAALGSEYSLVTDYTSMVVVKDTEFEDLGIDRKNARRVSKERKAQKKKAAKSAKNYNTQRNSSNQPVFEGFSSPNIGSGPVGTLFVIVSFLMSVVKRRND